MSYAKPARAPVKDGRGALSSLMPLLLLPLLAGAEPLSAQELLGNEPNRSVATATGAGIGTAIVEWSSLRQSSSLPFGSYAGFLLAHPGWPGEAAMRKMAEASLRPDAETPTRVVTFFSPFPAQSASATLRLAEALDSTGQRGDGWTMARRAWTTGNLSPDDESRLLLRFPGALTSADQDARMDRLLWNRSATAAVRQLALTSFNARPVFGARLALLTRAPDAFSKLMAVDSARGDAGLMYDRVNWLRGTGQEPAARALLSGPRLLTTRPLDPEKWYEMLLGTARAAAANGDWRSAYDIARQVDDAYPPGTDVRDRSLGERDDYTSLAWLAGTTALNRLNRPADALPMFDRYARAARSPQTQSKGRYWAGRAAEALGRRPEATTYYRLAGQYWEQFHGQLAIERLRATVQIPAITRTLEVSANQRAAYFAQEIVRAAQYLGNTGNWPDQSQFVRAIAAAATSDTDHLFALELACRLGRPDLAVMIGRSAGINGYRDYIGAGFPTVPVAAEDRASWTIVHAIARQESQFDRKIVSRAGARGTMQLMPGTARDTAGKLGLLYDPASLDDPRYNIQLGSWFFARLMDRYSGSYVLAVAAYNAGPGNVNKWLATNGDPRLPGADILAWIEAIPFTETRGYVQHVLENAVVYDLKNPNTQVHARAPLSALLGKPSPG